MEELKGGPGEPVRPKGRHNNPIDAFHKNSGQIHNLTKDKSHMNIVDKNLH